jgi:hypothetical protein
MPNNIWYVNIDHYIWFYIIIIVAEENITLADNIGDVYHPDIGRYFEEYVENDNVSYYVANEELRSIVVVLLIVTESLCNMS